MNLDSSTDRKLNYKLEYLIFFHISQQTSTKENIRNRHFS